VTARGLVALLAATAILVGGCDLGGGPRSAAPPTAVPAASTAASEPPTTPAPTPAPAIPASPAPWWPGGSAGSGYPALPVPVYPTPNPVAAGKARPTRVAIPSLDIDLPIVVPAKNERWPLCDVAEFLRDFDLPGQGGTTYIYAHAQRGMFLPILRASWRNNGRAMIGDTVYVWTADDRRYDYRISKVRRHQRSLSWAFDLPAESLVLQTSENQYASGPKVMLVARFRGVVDVPHAEAHPKARPRRCG
jgi:hypothetical protein